MSKSERTRQFIIEQAAPIFNKFGYEGTSMSQLTEAIGLTKGAIYGNFVNKDEIALEAFRFNVSRIVGQIAEIVKKHENSCDKLIALATYYEDEFRNLSALGGCPILNAAIDSDDAHRRLKKEVQKALRNWLDSVSMLVLRGIKRGEIKPETDAKTFATVYVALIEGGIMLSKATDDGKHLSRNVEQIREMIGSNLRK